MGAIETIISVKKTIQTNDLITLLDEIIAYRKLAKVKAFQDIRTSAPAQKKLPFLAKAYAGDLYMLSLAEVAGNVIAHLEGERPEVLVEPFSQVSPKQQKLLNSLSHSMVKANYQDLMEYDHDKMSGQVLGVYKKEYEKYDSLLIITREHGSYQIFQGHCQKPKEEGPKEIQTAVPFCLSDGDWELQIMTYSVQGNNAYPFGTVKSPFGAYQVMMPWYDVIWLLSGEPGSLSIRYVIPLEREQCSELQVEKVRIESFAACILEMVRKGMEQQHAEIE